MLVFVDESGDPGRKTDRGSSPYFTITTVVFTDRAAAQACDDAIAALRGTLGLSRHKEFKFNGDNERIRTAFLTEVANYDFFYSSFVLNKKKLTSEEFNVKESLYKYSVNIAFQNILPDISEATVVFDRCEREFNKTLRNYLRRKMNEVQQGDDRSKIKKIRDESSAANNLLQMADMICGAVSRSYSSESSSRGECRKLVKHRERRVQSWP